MVANVLSHPRLLPALALVGIASVLGTRAWEGLHALIYVDARGQPMKEILGKPTCVDCQTRLIWRKGVRYYCPQCGAITMARMIRLPTGVGVSQHVKIGYLRPHRRRRSHTPEFCRLRSIH